MKKLIIIITGSFLTLGSCQQQSGSQHSIQASSDSTSTTARKDSVADQRSDQNVKPIDTLNAAVPASWERRYSAYFSYGDIAGQNAGWELEINITNDKITAKGEGFQMAFVDELSAKASGSKLILTHLKNVSGYPRGKDMNPEFTLFNDNGKFYIQSEWIDGDVIDKLAKLGYPIDRTGF